MKKPNEKIRIADSEFVASQKAYKILDTYVRQVRRKYKLNGRVGRELEEALRDVLIESLGSISAPVRENLARRAIEIAGTVYEHQGSMTNIAAHSTVALRKSSKALLAVVRNRRVQKWFYSILAFLMLIPLGLAISTSPVIDETNWPDPNYSDTYTIETTIGYIKTGEYASTTKQDKEMYDSFASYRFASYISTVSVVVLLIVLFVLLARRSRRSPLVAGAVVVAVVCMISVNQQIFNPESSLWGGRIHSSLDTSPPIYTGRLASDLDTLYACGAEIQIVYIPQNDSMFYTLRDAGFTLNTELATKYLGEPPARKDLCETYNMLRKTYANEDIVLQDYVRDERDEVRPYDRGEERARGETGQKQLIVRTGFFTRMQ